MWLYAAFITLSTPLCLRPRTLNCSVPNSVQRVSAFPFPLAPRTREPVSLLGTSGDVSSAIESVIIIFQVSYTFILHQYTYNMHMERQSGARSALRKMVHAFGFPSVCFAYQCSTHCRVCLVSHVHCEFILACLLWLCCRHHCAVLQGVGGMTLYFTWFASFLLENSLIAATTAAVMGITVFETFWMYFFLTFFALLLYAVGCWAVCFAFRCADAGFASHSVSAVVSARYR